MGVTLGNASINEFGQVSGGQPGDQNGKEVCLRPWYANGWTDCMRPVDAGLAERIAAAMEAACANDKIGYSQAKRLTLYEQAKKVGYDLSRISEPCECDCSSLIAVCVLAGGVSISPSIYTGNECKALLNTGLFERMPGQEYLTEEKKLRRGDILIKQYYHTVMVLSDGEDAEPDDGIRYIDTDELNLRSLPNMSGEILAAAPYAAPVEVLAHEGEWARVRIDGFMVWDYLAKEKPKRIYRTLENLNLRREPGMEGKVLTTIPSGSIVDATGNTERISGTLWREVIWKNARGWASGDYLS